MRDPSLDRQFERFMERHTRCGGVTVKRLEPLLPSTLTLRVCCACGVSSEWCLTPPRAVWSEQATRAA